MRIPVRLAALLFAASAAVAAPPASAASRLFPELARKDFPEKPDSVALRWVEVRPGAATLHAFHWREGDIGFPSVLTATSSLDSRTGEPTFEVLRVDDHCLAVAEERRLAERDVCSTLTTTTLAKGVERLVFRSRYFDYQVQLTLVQSPDGSDTWDIVPTGRRGEPRTLRLSTDEDGDGNLVVAWELASSDGERTIVLPLSAAVPLAGLREVGLAPFHAGVLSAIDLFYDISDLYVPDWVLMREDQIVDTGIPSPEENDPSDCELVGVCGAERETCIPTIGGWLACDIDSGFDWGGKFDDGLVGQPPPDPIPDWRTGPMTYPSAPEPLFNGIRNTSGSYRLRFELTSILIRSNTIALMQPSPVGQSAKHVVRLTLVPSGETAPAVPGCTEIWATAQAAGTGVANGDKVAYPTGSPKHRSCSEPAEGLYELRYELDPFDKWDEDSHEDNNQGTARGVWYYPG